MSHMGQKDPLDQTTPNTKWTLRKGDKIVALLEEGRFKVHACAIANIHITTLHNWIEADEKELHRDIELDETEERGEGNKPWPGFTGFSSRVREAEAKYCIQAEAQLEKLASAGKNPDWKSEAWLLEKKFPKLYGEAAKQIELSGKLTVNRSDIIKAIDEAEKDEDNEKSD